MDCKNMFHYIIVSQKIVEFDRVIAKCIFFSCTCSGISPS